MRGSTSSDTFAPSTVRLIRAMCGSSSSCGPVRRLTLGREGWRTVGGGPAVREGRARGTGRPGRASPGPSPRGRDGEPRPGPGPGRIGVIVPTMERHDLPVDPDVPAPGQHVLAAVAAGGALGSAGRWVVSAGVPAAGGFPWPTFLVNVTGALLIGVLMVVVTDVVTGRPLLRPFL